MSEVEVREGDVQLQKACAVALMVDDAAVRRAVVGGFSLVVQAELQELVLACGFAGVVRAHVGELDRGAVSFEVDCACCVGESDYILVR